MQEMSSRYQSEYGRDMSGLQFNIGGKAVQGHIGLAVGRDLVVLSEEFFGVYTPPDVQYSALGHELFHIHIARIEMGSLYGAFSSQYSYWGNPLEVSAAQNGADFASRVLGTSIPPDPRYVMPSGF